jgi:hypothetical protein
VKALTLAGRGKCDVSANILEVLSISPVAAAEVHLPLFQISRRGEHFDLADMSIQLPFVPYMGGVSIAALAFAKATATSTATCLTWSLGPALLLYLTYYCFIYPFYISPLRHIPTVPGFPLWGQFFMIITEEVGVPARRWHQEHGTIIRYFFPLGAERLSIADDDAIKHMTVRNPYNFPKPQRARLWMMPILGEGVLLAEGQTHVKQRKALTPAFSITSIRSLLPVFWAKSLHLSHLLEGEIEDSTTGSRCFEVLEWLNRTTLDIIGRAGLGTDINSLDNPDTPLREAYKRCFDFDLQARILNGLAAFTPMIRLIPAKANRDMANSRRVILSKATDIINEKQADAEAQREQKTRDIIGLIIKDNATAKNDGEDLADHFEQRLTSPQMRCLSTRCVIRS